MAQGRGWEGAVLKLMRAKDFTFTVTGAEDVTPRYRRVHLTDGGMLGALGVHPTMWVRLWFDNAGRPHQRAYTLVDPDPAAGTFSLEFALHEGCASDWARAAKPSDTIEATVQGTGFQDPDPAPSHVFAVADPASLPALNSLLGTLAGAPATVWFEGDHTGLPLSADAARHEVRAVETPGRRRPPGGAGEGGAAGTAAGRAGRRTSGSACDTATRPGVWPRTSARRLGLPARQRVNALGYWRATCRSRCDRRRYSAVTRAPSPRTAEADALLGRSPLAALVGMLLGPAGAPMEWAFQGPATIARRHGRPADVRRRARQLPCGRDQGAVRRQHRVAEYT
ncbi:hypothetical protein SFUMM280S_01210 [Streptomyces fumanus]